jgi:hypothetical protein
LIRQPKVLNYLQEAQTKMSDLDIPIPQSHIIPIDTGAGVMLTSPLQIIIENKNGIENKPSSLTDESNTTTTTIEGINVASNTASTTKENVILTPDIDSDEILKKAINDRLDKMIQETGAEAAWKTTDSFISGSYKERKVAPPLLVFDYTPVTFRSNQMSPDLLRNVTDKSKTIITQENDLYIDEEFIDANWMLEDAAEEVAARPPALNERKKTSCGRVADGAGHIPKRVSIASCPIGTTIGETIQLYGPVLTISRRRSIPLPTVSSHFTVVDILSKVNEVCELPYSPTRIELRKRAFPRACVLGPDWPFLCLTYFLILIPSLCWLFLVTTRLHIALFSIGAISILVLVFALAMTAFSDPGIVPKQTPAKLVLQKKRIARAAEIAEQQQCGKEFYRPGVAGATALSRFSTCSQCNVLRLYGTSHCTICNACCVGLDHHCPWTGKCIGKGNLTPFFVFVYSLGIHIALIITSTIALFATGKYTIEMLFVFQ